MATKAKKISISEQIKAALDGRTQRWLAYQIAMAEDKLSNKLNGYDDFNQDELNKINEVLNTSIELTE